MFELGMIAIILGVGIVLWFAIVNAKKKEDAYTYEDGKDKSNKYPYDDNGL